MKFCDKFSEPNVLEILQWREANNSYKLIVK
jgi:hypothetical protein